MMEYLGVALNFFTVAYALFWSPSAPEQPAAGDAAQLISNSSFTTLMLIFSFSQILASAQDVSTALGLAARVAPIFALSPPLAEEANAALVAPSVSSLLSESIRRGSLPSFWALIRRRDKTRSPPPPRRSSTLQPHDRDDWVDRRPLLATEDHPRASSSGRKATGSSRVSRSGDGPARPDPSSTTVLVPTPLAGLAGAPRRFAGIDLEVSVHALGVDLRRSLGVVFPDMGLDLEGETLTAVVTMQRVDASRSMDEALSAFLNFSGGLRDRIEAQGYWCRAIGTHRPTQMISDRSPLPPCPSIPSFDACACDAVSC